VYRKHNSRSRQSQPGLETSRPFFPFDSLPRFIQDDPELTPRQKQLCLNLGRRCWDKPFCFPSIKTLQRQLGSKGKPLGARTVRYDVAACVAAGYLARKQVGWSEENKTGWVYVCRWFLPGYTPPDHGPRKKLNQVRQWSKNLSESLSTNAKNLSSALQPVAAPPLQPVATELNASPSESENKQTREGPPPEPTPPESRPALPDAVVLVAHQERPPDRPQTPAEAPRKPAVVRKAKSAPMGALAWFAWRFGRLVRGMTPPAAAPVMPFETWNLGPLDSEDFGPIDPRAGKPPSREPPDSIGGEAHWPTGPRAPKPRSP
jgi:hypothetical protein